MSISSQPSAAEKDPFWLPLTSVMLCLVTRNKIWRFCCSKELHLQLENSSNLDPREIERAKKGQVGCALVRVVG